MFTKKIIKKENLLSNINELKLRASPKQICVMVKAEAYGHGMQEIVELIKNEISVFGVSNEEEALHFREFNSDSHVIIFGAVEDYVKMMRENIAVALLSYSQLKELIKCYKKTNIPPKLHLNINTGMNRFGIKTKREFDKIINLLKKYNLQLEGIYTHFSSMTTDADYTQKQKKLFYSYVQRLPKEWNTTVHVGGGNSLFEDFDCDMVRIGMLAYGYGGDFVQPCMEIHSKIVDLQPVEKGEHVGYLCGFTATNDMIVATIPLGYADGLPRKLSNIFNVYIKGKEAKSCGNICMDTFMVDVSHIHCQVGDDVVIMRDAEEIGEILQTTPYEVCTNFAPCRAKTIIE